LAKTRGKRGLGAGKGGGSPMAEKWGTLLASLPAREKDKQNQRHRSGGAAPAIAILSNLGRIIIQIRFLHFN
jgi:hypothetical protein